MAEMTENEREMIHENNANLSRVMADVRSLSDLTQSMKSELAVLAERHKALSKSVDDLMKDRSSLFKWAMGLIATFVIAASALTLKGE